MEIMVPLDKILPNPEQPRREFDQADLESLAESLKTIQLQSILVEAADDGFYILHDGERRTRAARLAGLTAIRASVIPPSPNEEARLGRLLNALVANVQRTDLNPIEEGHVYAKMQAAGLSISEIVRRTGIYHKRITDRLIWTKLSAEIQQLVATKAIPSDLHVAHALLALPIDARLPFAQKMASKPGLTIAAICNAAARYAEVFPPSSPHDEYITGPITSDALVLGSPAIRTITGRSPSNNYNALVAAHRQPPWEQFKTAVIETCKTCALYDFASPSTCQDCPLVNHVNRITGV